MTNAAKTCYIFPGFLIKNIFFFSHKALNKLIISYKKRGRRGQISSGVNQKDAIRLMP